MPTDDDDRQLARIGEALEKVIKDTVGCFDECLVDRLFASIVAVRTGGKNSDRNSDPIGAVWNHCDFELYDDLNGINLTRLLRYHSCTSAVKQLSFELNIVKSFIRNLPAIIMRQSTPEITAALSLLFNLLDYKSIQSVTRDPLHPMNHIKAARYDTSPEIKNVIDLIKYCLITSKVYQVQDLAKKIFSCLILECSIRKSPMLNESIKAATRELLLEKKSTLMYQILYELFSDFPGNLRKIDLIQSIVLLLKQAFEESLKEKDSPNLSALSKCMALIDVPKSDIITRLESRNDLDAILMYAINKDVFDESSLMYFVFYPILVRCQSEDAQVLTGMLIVTREEKIFIDRNLKDRHVLQCLTYLQQVVAEKLRNISIKTKWKVYILDVALEYFKCNFDSPQAYKNLIQCCKIMKDFKNVLLDRSTARSTWLSELINVLLRKIDETDYQSYCHKSVFLHMLELLEESQISLNYFKGASDKFKRNFIKTIELASKFTDPEVLNAFTKYFYRMELANFYCIPKHLESKRYAQLVWDHILPIAKDSNHAELTGTVAALLIHIDVRLPESALVDSKIKRHVDIPRVIGDILIENKHVYTIAEQITDAICHLSCNDFKRNRIKKDYLEWLDDYGRSEDSKLATDHLIKGMCESMRGECSEEAITTALMMIESVSWGALYAAKRVPENITRLCRMGLLDVFYEIYNCHLYKRRIKDRITKECHTIGESIKMDKDKLEELIKPYTSRAKELSEFFTSSKFKEKYSSPYPVPPKEKDEIGLASYLDDILDTERISEWGVTECY